MLFLQFIFLMYVFKSKPYKEKYFNILALIDEVGAFLSTAVAANFVFFNSAMSPVQKTVMGFVYGIIAEIVLILNLVFVFIYYGKRNPPEYEYQQEYVNVAQDKQPVVKVPPTV